MVYLLIRLKLFIFPFSTHFFVHFIDYSPWGFMRYIRRGYEFCSFEIRVFLNTKINLYEKTLFCQDIKETIRKTRMTQTPRQVINKANEKFAEMLCVVLETVSETRTKRFELVCSLSCLKWSNMSPRA